MIRNLLLTTAASGIVFAAGCHHKCCLNDPDRRPKPYQPGAPSTPFLLPPAGLPTTPAGPGSPSVPVVPAPSSVVPPVGPVDPRNYPPPDFGASPRPVPKPAPEILLPDPIPGGASSRSSSPGDPGFGVLGSPARPQINEPTINPATTTGLPGMVKVAEGLTSGRKPSLDGLDSLKKAGYRTVVYLHPAGVDVSPARDVAEKRGLAFRAIETTPEKLATAIEVFNATVADKAARPTYVFDDDGVRAGTLWYLHFRTAEAMNDDVARVRAKPLGLTDQGDEVREFSLATQRYLETH